jgi:hypothetical protein
MNRLKIRFAGNRDVDLSGKVFPISVRSLREDFDKALVKAGVRISISMIRP